MIFKQIKNQPDFKLPKSLTLILSEYEFVFNPSYVFHSEINYFAIRLFDKKLGIIKAIIYSWDNSEDINNIDLSSFLMDNFKIKKVADPKLFVMNNKVYCTCNSGDGQDYNFNKLMLVELNSNEIITHNICNYKQRNKTEKNWAFYSKNNHIYALYSLSPLTILKAKSCQGNVIDFVKYFSDSQQVKKNLSIGTPIISVGKELFFFGHKKYYNKKKRLYVGKLCKVSLENEPRLTVKNTMYIHSLKSMLGEEFKFNKNLISCTYFSCFFLKNENLILGYGVNDISWKIKILKFKKLCQ
ncbi:hypothetical protein [Winogradskyella sp.]|uniref:hypothetical protein n=1 Tax=Winogradskyella sp. TaxID=1883156 RepID=UPI0035C8395B